ncbi:hypothetical protein [Actinacidiphila yeochonensis]|uniref:hypothetical protein n=1 Tax=Actinacidiphila yeochonensis TaxID=89050 RepID=UPI0006899975|nr:hypothetical protein [Actinacidiphila yeochonensis]
MSTATAAAVDVVVPGPRQRRAAVDPGQRAAPEGVVRRQRVRVPWRLVASAAYPDVALSVYVKVAALQARPEAEGCEARTETLAGYLGVSTASVERGLTALRRPGPTGEADLATRRRTLPGGRGTSAVRRVRPASRAESFVWVPVAAAEDLSPRQLRAFAAVAYAGATGIALTEGELAGYLFHHSGKRAGQPIGADAAGAVVDEVEAAGWLTVQRRAGAYGRHVLVAHDIAPEGRTPAEAAVDADAAGDVPEDQEHVQEQVPPGTASQEAAGTWSTAGSCVGEGSGSVAGEGSLASKESPTTDSPDDERALASPAVGEVPVVPVENRPTSSAAARDGTGLALRADEEQLAPKAEGEKRSKGGGPVRPSYDGPQLTMNAQIYAVLEPVHWVLERVDSAFVQRQIAREVGRQLRAGADPERLAVRLRARFAASGPSEIRDPGRWLLGVALPRWGCGLEDCEAGTLWSSGMRCEVCAAIVADQRRARRSAQGLCPDHGTAMGPSGACPACEDDRAPRYAVQLVPGELDDRPRGACGDCGARIFLTGAAVVDGLCRGCRQDREGRVIAAPPGAGRVTCTGLDGVPCDRPALPTRPVCRVHRAQQVALADAEKV